ncbi:MAG: hypothetical protein AAF989_05215, partial [Planctomycetota bacterium]
TSLNWRPVPFDSTYSKCVHDAIVATEDSHELGEVTWIEFDTNPPVNDMSSFQSDSANTLAFEATVDGESVHLVAEFESDFYEQVESFSIVNDQGEKMKTVSVANPLIDESGPTSNEAVPSTENGGVSDGQLDAA